MALAAFIFNTTEFVPVGLLTNLGQSFDMSAAEIGPMITIYAWVVALTSLPAMLLLAQVERKRLLMAIFILFIISHLISAMATSYHTLLVSRIGIALAHAVFWSITAAMAVRLAPPGKASQALGLLATGTVLAMVLGIPLGRIIGQYLGWRVTFAGIGLLAFMVMLALWHWLPKVEASNSGDRHSLPTLMRNKPLLWLYLLTVIVVTAQFTAFTYLEPLIQQVFKFTPEITTWVLLIFGGAGIIGSLLFSRYNGQHPQYLMLSGILVLGASLFALAKMGTHLPTLILLAFIWGAAMMLSALALQYRVLKYGSAATDISMAIYSGIFNIGIGAGALLGSRVTMNFGVEYNGLVGGIIILLALLPLWYLLVKRKPIPKLPQDARFRAPVG